MAVVGDPVGSGFVASLARPGANITGFSKTAEHLSGKRLDLLKELVPGLTQTAAVTLGTTPLSFDFTSESDLEAAFGAMARERVQAAVVLPQPLVVALRRPIAELAMRHRMPVMFPSPEPVETGGLVAYGPSHTELWQRAASYVDRILKGAASCLARAAHCRAPADRTLAMLTMRAVAVAMTVLTAAVACSPAMTPLHEAAATGNTELVKSWIASQRDLDVTYDEPSSGIEGNYARAQGLTALMTAARMGHLEIVKLLVEGGANLYAESRLRDGTNPQSAFDYAVGSGRRPIVEYLWTRSDGVRFASRLDRHIAATCSLGCDDKVGGDARSNLALFLIGITRDDAALGRGIGEAACHAPQPLQVLTFLHKHGVRFPRNTVHCIAYHSTARQLHSPAQRMAAASFLLDHGADPNDLPHTPLRGAAAAHDIEMVQLLLARGADPNLRNDDGVTAIGAAANSCIQGADAAQLEARQKPQLAVIDRLARAGADATLSPAGRSRLQILSTCCSRTPHTTTQRQICAVFGL